jgi:hypothetical protein
MLIITPKNHVSFRSEEIASFALAKDKNNKFTIVDVLFKSGANLNLLYDNEEEAQLFYDNITEIITAEYIK